MNYRLLKVLSLASLFVFSAAQAAEETITVHHFLSPKAPAHQQLMVPWAEDVEEQSGGRIKVEIFPSMAMGGKPPELYRQVRDGAADVVWTLIGYTPGVFPRSEVFELPTIHRGSALATTLAIQDVFAQLEDDYRNVKILLLHVHQGNAIHMAETPIKSVADLKGLKLRTPSRTGAWLIEAWEAEPVGMPLPALPQALSKGVVDGALIPFEIFPPFKMHQLTKYSIEGPGGLRFGTSVFMFAMNKQRYEKLPADLKAVIDANSGASIAKRIGQVWINVEAPGIKMQKASGSPVDQLDAATMAEFDNRSNTVVERWVKAMDEKGIDGEGLVKAARAAVASHSK